MKIQKGMRFKAIDGISKGKTFTVLSVDNKQVVYRSEFTDATYTADRKHFEKYIQRVNKYWADTTKAYKRKKDSL